MTNDKPAREFDEISSAMAYEDAVKNHPNKDIIPMIDWQYIHTWWRKGAMWQYQALKLENERLFNLRLDEHTKDEFYQLARKLERENGDLNDEKYLLKAENAELKTELGRWEATQPQNIESYMELKAENAELRVELARKSDNLSEYISMANDRLDRCIKAESEVARLREKLDKIDFLAFQWGYSAISELSREALNHKPKGEKE